MRALTLLAVLLGVAAHAGDELNPENVAKIQTEQAKANAEVDKKYGNKKPNELSPDERRSMQKEKAAAEREVLDKHGTDSKAYARANSKMSREDRAATDAAAKDLEKKGAEAPATADPKKGGKKEIVIQKNGKGAPGPDDDANAAAEMDRAAGLGKGKSKK